MHYRQNESPEGCCMDLNSLSQEGKPEAALTWHPSSGWCKPSCPRVYGDLCSQRETGRRTPTDHCCSLPEPHDGRLEIIPLIQAMSMFIIKWQLLWRKKPQPTSLSESAVASCRCLHQGARRRRGVPASRLTSHRQLSFLLSTSLQDEAFYWKTVECNVLPGCLGWATVLGKMDLNPGVTGLCPVVGLPPRKAEG